MMSRENCCLKLTLGLAGLLCCAITFYIVFFLPEVFVDDDRVQQRTAAERFLRKARAAEIDCFWVLTAEKSVKTLTSPNYPDHYPSHADCQWLITTFDSNATLSLKINTLSVEPDEQCTLDYLKVFLGFTVQAPSLGPFCGHVSDEIIHTNSSSLLLLFHSDSMYEDRGFSIDYFIHHTNRGCKELTTETSDVLTSPGYPDSYPANTDCSTLIAVPRDKKVVLHFHSVDLENEENCTFDYIRVFDGKDINSSLLGHICKQSDERSFESSSNFLLVHFHSDSSVNRKGYRAHYSTVDKGSNFYGNCHWQNDERNGTMTSPNYPDDYPSFANCSLCILAPEPDTKILLTFDKVDLEVDSNCSYDFLQINEGPQSDSQVVGRYCGRGTEPKSWLSNANEICVQFRSDSYVQFQGFKLRYEFIGKHAEKEEEEEEEEEDWFSFRRRPQNATLAVGASHMLHCDTDHPNARIRWLKGDTFLTEGALPKELRLLPNNTLWITKMQRHLVGEYTCVAVSPEEDIVATALIKMEDESDDCEIEFRKTPFDSEFKEGGFAHMECLVATPDVVISWEKDGRPLQPQQHVTVLKNGYIYKDGVTLDDSGLYSCVAQDAVSGCVQRKSATMSISEKTKVEEICGRPKIEGTAMENGLGKIVGGNDAQKGAYPWQVMLSETGRGLFCGGTLLNDRWVLTAAHCLINNKHTISWDRIVVKLGKHDTVTDEPQEVHTTVADSSAIVEHPRFTRANFDNDLALIRLRNRVHFTDYILPICLGDRDMSERLLAGDGQGPKMGTVVGWGKLKENGPSPRFLQEIKLPLVDHEVCINSTDYSVTRNMFCAGYSQEVIGDSCHGDSGGPFMRRHDGRWYLLGIVSWGEGCGKKNKYGFYTRIPNHMSWIQGIIKS